MIRDGGDDTARLKRTVAGHVETALMGRGVVGVDVVPGAGVGELRDVGDFVGEEGRFGDVLAVKEGVGEVLG